HEMSGGQRQRVVIAMAMLLKPKLIIADEPTTALDKAVEGKILALLKKLVRESGAALWLISHDLEVVAEVADEVVVLFRGETVETGPAKQVFTVPKHPYTKGLLGCRPPKEGRPFPLPVLEDFLNDTIPSKQADLAAPKAADEVMTITGLRIGFDRRTGFRKTKQWIINGIDLHLKKGETLGLIGPSGSGKSSIGRAIVGLNSFESTAFSYTGDASKIQFIFQDPFSALNGSKRIGWILDSVLKRHRPDLSSLERLKEAQSLLEEVGLSVVDLRKRPKAFSGGQRQRIGIARALAAAPEVLICDESVSALDVSVQSQVLNVLNGIKKNRGLSMIFISHDPDVIRYMCDRIVELTPVD
ncbi:MAG: ATP-binding cassette domain-containing protein, partial [Schleiferiaceae bacterium]|nr:ATP-binding cassette domain-containing protein [Schleiferiaceae bacterium]